MIQAKKFLGLILVLVIVFSLPLSVFAQDDVIPSGGQISEQGSENPSEQGNENSSEQGGENSSEQGSENSSEQGSENPSEQGNENSSEQGSENSSEQGSENSSEQGSENSSEQGSENSSEQGSENSSEQGSENSSEQGSENSSEQGSENSSEQGSENSSEQGSENSSEQGGEDTSEPSSEDTSEPSSEDTSEPSSEDTSEPSSEPVEEPLEELYFENKLLIGWKRADGAILFNPQDTPDRNGNMLYYLLSNDNKKTIILPAKTIKIKRTLYVGDNTTIIATGANIIQIGSYRPIIDHVIDKDNYNSVKNVSITGGTWYIRNIEKAKKEQASTIRFCHAQNIKLQDVTITTGYICHAFSLVACKNVTVDKCKFTAIGTAPKDRIEESVQIDISTKKTAPNCAKVGAKFVKGQICKNIKVTNCVIKGGKGLCANKTDSENGKWLKKHHVGITVKGCSITGVTGEALALHNTAKFIVDDNTIISKSTRTDVKGYTYSIGVNIRTFKKNSVISKYEGSVSRNVIKGGYIGLYIGPDKYREALSKKIQFGKVTIANNKIYYKKGKTYKTIAGKAKASSMQIYHCKNKKSNNKAYKW